jgi:nitrile hydratase
MELFEAEFPQRGARVIAHAWVDAKFRKRLLEDGKAACAEWGLDLEADRLIAVENTPQVHNVIVCTLCSCYPRALLGMPPTWYKSDNYRRRVVREPRAVLKEFGTVIPEHVSIRVHDSNADMRYVVLPMRPKGTEHWSEELCTGLPSPIVTCTFPEMARERPIKPLPFIVAPEMSASFTLERILPFWYSR